MAEIRELKTLLSYDQETIVKALEAALEMAKTGELRAVAIAGVTSDGGTYNYTVESSYTPALIGSAALLLNKLLTDARAQSTSFI